MTIKIRIPKSGGEKSGKGIRGLPGDPVVRAGLIVFLILAVGFTAFFSYFYIKYDRIIEKRFRNPVFANSAKIYALPRVVREGEKIDARDIAAELRRAGYSDQEGASKLGTFHVVKGGIDVTPAAAAQSFPPTNWSRNWSRPCSMRGSARNVSSSSTTTSLPSWSRLSWRSKTDDSSSIVG